MKKYLQLEIEKNKEMEEYLNGFETLNIPIGTQFEVRYLLGETTRQVEVYKNDEGIFI